MTLRVFGQALVLTVVSASLAVGMNLVRTDPLPWLQDRTAERLAAIPAEEQISITQALGLTGRDDVLFVDARPAEDFAAGHIPGSLSFPFDPFDDDVEPKLAALPKDKTLVVYCSTIDCSLGEDLAETLKLYDYTNVKVMLEGMKGWQDAGGQLAEGES